jgi:hypothetical protein
MLKRFVSLGVCAAFVVGTVFAQPAPQGPAPAPAPDPGAGSGSGAGKTNEKAGTNESLQNGGAGARPWAQGVSPSEQQTALKMFRDGNNQLNDGLFAKAADIYKDALKHWDHPAIHYNLALAEMNLDQPVAAYDDLKASMKFGDAPLQSKDKLDNAKQYLLLLDKQIAEIEVSCDKVGAKVSVDGQPVFTAPGHFKQRVRAGKHTFVAEKQGYTTRINAPYVSPGAPFNIELKLYTAEELTRYHRKWNRTWVPWVVAGAGVAIGGAASLMAMSSKSSYDDFDRKVAECSMTSGTGTSGCEVSSDLTKIRDSGDTKRTLSFVGFGLAGATVATGLLLVWINRKQPYQIRAEDLQGEQFTVAPIITPTMAGAAVQGRF